MRPPLIRFGNFAADLKAGEIRKHGIRLKLQKQPFDVLAALLDRPGEIVSRDELRRRLWPDGVFVDYDRGLNKAVNRLREILGDDAEQPRFIETVPQRGYRFIGEIDWGERLSVESALEPELDKVLIAVAAKSRVRQGTWAAIAVAVAVAVPAIGTFAWRGAADPPVHSIAVLPLENLSGDPAQEYFSDGMTDELIGELAHISTLHVISRTSIMRYKGAAIRKTLPEIARELKVDAIVEGTVANG